MDNTKIFRMPFAKVYPLYIQKAEKKGKSKAEVDALIFWLTGYDEQSLKQLLANQTDFENFFASAPKINPNADKITGVICGYRVEEIEDKLMQQIRYLDKLVDELAKGKGKNIKKINNLNKHHFMSELKTKQNEADVLQFIETFADTEQKKKDSMEILHLMQETSGCEPKMWGASIIGFGSYHYKSERSRQEGDWFMVGFSPRKAAISLYLYAGVLEQEGLLHDLGKFKAGKGCIYVKKLSDIQQEVLKKLIKSSIDMLQTQYGK